MSALTMWDREVQFLTLSHISCFLQAPCTFLKLKKMAHTGLKNISCLSVLEGSQPGTGALPQGLLPPLSFSEPQWPLLAMLSHLPCPHPHPLPLQQLLLQTHSLSFSALPLFPDFFQLFFMLQECVFCSQHWQMAAALYMPGPQALGI